jgi:hypothetical protein
MRGTVLIVLVACGEPQRPVLANAPHPDNAAVAGGAAAAAAAAVIADPNAATRGKPEKHESTEEKQPIEVKENVPKDVFDRLDQRGATGSDATPAAAPAGAKATKKKGPLPKLPSPKEAAEKEENGKATP